MEREHERAPESASPSSFPFRVGGARLETVDVKTAIARAEGVAGSRVIDDAGRPAEMLSACRAAVELGQRVAAVAPARAFAAVREDMRRIASSRLAMVAHALAGHGAEELSALLDLGWAILCASGPEDSFDLTLIARRAAEDAGVPFLVVHGQADAASPAGRAIASVALPDAQACSTFVGKARLQPHHDPSHPSLSPLGDRSFGERVPFALGAAMRDYGSISGRRHDVFDKAPLGEASVVIVGMGPLGAGLVAGTAELRARGHDVGALQITVLRPFPAARLVKALARALAVTVLEPTDESLAQGGLLAREVKSAFADALTWVPGFPGIGRVPKLFVGSCSSARSVAIGASAARGSASPCTLEDVEAVCENMLADERGRRTFALGEPAHGLTRPARRSLAVAAGALPLVVRWHLDAEQPVDDAIVTTASALAAAYGLRTHATVTASGKMTVVDLALTRDPLRSGFVRDLPRLLLASDAAMHAVDIGAGAAPGALLGVLGGPGGAVLDDAVRVAVREHGLRALPIAVAEQGLDARVALSAGLAAATLAMVGQDPADGAQAAQVVREHLQTGAGGAGEARRVEAPAGALAVAKRAFDAVREALEAALREDARARALAGDGQKGFPRQPAPDA